ncbi:MAG: MFS transporter [Polyangiales bacterium]
MRGLSDYQRRLVVFLSVATFFEGYDMLALTQLLPNLRRHFALSESEGGAMIALINVGTVLAYFLVRLADRWGRRRVLSVTIAGYTVMSFLSALAPNAVVFALAQLCARVFLIGEWAVAMVVAAEEFPADRRGTVIGVIQGFSSLGAIVCAGLVPLMLKAPMGWRTVYMVGAVPLVILAWARRDLRETTRFVKQQETLAPPSVEPAAGELASPYRPERAAATRDRPLTAILRGPWRKRVFVLSAVWFCTYICTQNAVTFWKEFAVHDRGLTDGAVGLSVSIAALASMPLVFYAGRLLDRVGRRVGAAVILGAAALGTFTSYTAHDRWALTASLVLSVFGASAVLSLLNAYTTELFPTDQRGDAFAWSNNLLGRLGYVLSPLALGFAAQRVGWGAAVAPTAVFALVALGIVWVALPETRGRELEDTARL